MASLYLADFSGGINYRDSPNQIQPNEAQDSANFTLDERGALKWRNGCSNIAALPGTSGTNAYIFWSEAISLFLCARASGGTLKLFTSPTGVTWTDRGTINSTSTSGAAFIDFPGATPKAVIATDGNGATRGIWTIDATPTVTNVSGNAIEGDFQGNSIVLWQDRAVVGGYPINGSVGNVTSIFACAPKDPTKWTTANGGWTQQIREKDANPVTGLGIAGGGLVAYKKRSTYRVNDSATGAYTTIDPQSGCVNPLALVASRGRLYSWGADGMYECDGVGSLRNVGDRIRPVYTDSGTTTASVCAGTYKENVIFAGVFSSVQQIFEYSPSRGWIMRHLIGSSSQDKFTSFASKDGVTYGAVADGDDFFRVFTETPCTDDATLALGAWTSPWLLPNSGMLARLNRVVIQGLIGVSTTTTLGLTVFKDWDYTGGTFDTFQIETALRAPNSSHKNSVAQVMAIGHASSFQIQLDCGTAAGAVAIRSIQLVDTVLQWPNPGYPRTGRPSLTNRPTMGGNVRPPTS